VTTPSGGRLRFAGIVTAVNPPEIAAGDKMEMTMTIKATGSPIWIPAGGSAPTNTVLPAVSGTVQEGQTLTALPGVWTGSPSFTYQWQELITATWTAISGATNATLVVPGGSTVGRQLRVVVTGSNSAGSLTVNSAATVAVIAA